MVIKVVKGARRGASTSNGAELDRLCNRLVAIADLHLA